MKLNVAYLLAVTAQDTRRIGEQAAVFEDQFDRVIKRKDAADVTGARMAEADGVQPG